MTQTTKIINGLALGFGLIMMGAASADGFSFGALLIGAGCYLFIRMGLGVALWLWEPVGQPVSFGTSRYPFDDDEEE